MLDTIEAVGLIIVAVMGVVAAVKMWRE